MRKAETPLADSPSPAAPALSKRVKPRRDTSKRAVATIGAYRLGQANAPSLLALAADLEQQTQQLRDGEMAGIEELMLAQANTLDAIFNKLALKAVYVMDRFPNQGETYLRTAIKAQSQCRVTLEALAAIKNPRSVAVIQQANIAAGPQQINNNTPRSGGTETAPNELSIGGGDNG